jgi:methyl-accepting chemotaxis protein
MTKLGDIKDTTSNIVSIITELGSHETIESLDKIKETAKTVEGIMESLKDPEMVKNIENIRLTSEAMRNAAAKMNDAVSQLKETGIIEEAKETTISVRTKVNSFRSGDNGQNLKDMIIELKDMIRSVKNLADEIKLAVPSFSFSSSNQSTLINTKNKVKEGS